MKEAEVEPAAAPEAKKDEKAAEPEAPKEEAAEKEEAPAEADGDKNAKRTLSETDGAAAEEKDGKSPKVPPPLRKFPQAQLDAPCPEPARRRLHFRATPRPGSTRSTRRRPPRPTACPPTRLTASDASRSPTPAVRWTPRSPRSPRRRPTSPRCRPRRRRSERPTRPFSSDVALERRDKRSHATERW